MTHEELKLLLSDAENAQRQLVNLVARLRHALGNPVALPAAAPAKPAVRSTKQEKRPVDPKWADQLQRPNDALLMGWGCPKCKAPMLWKYSRSSGEWFAGCTTFSTQHCTGSRNCRDIALTSLSVGASEASTPPWKTEHFGDALEAPSDWVQQGDQAFEQLAATEPLEPPRWRK